MVKKVEAEERKLFKEDFDVELVGEDADDEEETKNRVLDEEEEKDIWTSSPSLRRLPKKKYPREQEELEAENEGDD